MRTEQISLRYLELDSWPTDEMIAAMYEGQLAAAAAVRSALTQSRRPSRTRSRRCSAADGSSTPAPAPPAASACRMAPSCRQPSTGRRIVSCLPWRADLDALVRSAEQAEDNEAAGAQAMADAKIGANDVVIGVAASGTTPFTSAHCGRPPPRVR